MELCRADNATKVDPKDIEEDNPERYREHLERIVELQGGKSIKAKTRQEAWRKQRDAAPTPAAAPAAALPVTKGARERAEECFRVAA